MAEASGELWLRQAASDLEAAKQLLALSNSTLYCHVVAKYQQAVEKAIKGLTAALKEAKLTGQGPTHDHKVEKEIVALKRLAGQSRGIKASKNEDTLRAVSEFINGPYRADINSLLELAPSRNNNRNTEYPFLDAQANSTIPSGASVFTQSEVDRFRKAADRVVGKAEIIVSALSRTP